MGVEGPHKRRRRRGGRGRKREGAPTMEANASPAANVEGTRGAREGHRPSRERGGAESGTRPSRQVAATAVHASESAPKKPGFFRRLARLFTGR